MTERLYYTSDATECLARVVNCLSEADGRYAIELDRTLFHLQGGGQPADRGWIADLAVEGVVSRGDSVAHIVSQPLPSGGLPEASALLEKVAAWQAGNLPRQVAFADGLRQIGFGDMQSYPCGGTHVASLSELGKIVISQVKMKKGQIIVSYTVE